MSLRTQELKERLIFQETGKIGELDNKISDFMLETKLRFDTMTQAVPENSDSGAIEQPPQSETYHPGWYPSLLSGKLS